MTRAATEKNLHALANVRNVLIQKKAKERGVVRSNEVRRKVEKAMELIKKEMAENEGTYPQNKGAVSAAEVARRAAVHPTTLFSQNQRELGNEVRKWVQALKKKEIVGRIPVRRTLAHRIADWKELYDRLAQTHRDTELELQATEAELEGLRADLNRIVRENAALEKILAGGKVVPLLPKRK